MPAAAPFSVIPSALARYFFHDCERFLRYRCATSAQRQADGLPEREFDHSPLMQAIMDNGCRWEAEVVQKHLAGKVRIAPGTGELSERRFTYKQSLDLFLQESPECYLYQTTLRAPPRLYQQYGVDPALVSFRDNHPDLIAVFGEPGRRLLRVIDVKRGTSLQIAHRVQILLYALELQAILDEEGITDARVDLECGAVWLGNTASPTEFDLAAVRPHVEQFLRHDLSRILRQSAPDAPWHVFFRCEWCEYFPDCRKEMEATDDLSRLSNLTCSGKRHLVQLGVKNIAGLETFLARTDADEALARCASLAGERHYLQNKVKSLRTKKPRTHGTSSPALPKGENIAVFLTLQREPLGGETYLAGMLVNIKAELQPLVLSPDTLGRLFDAQSKARPLVLVSPTPQDVAAVRKEFLGLLYQVFQQVHAYNEPRDPRDKLTLQVYVHTERERDQLVAWLLESLEDADLAEPAMQLLFFLQGPDLLLTDHHPGTPLPYSVVVMLSALGRLMALPVSCSYTLPEALQSLGSGYHYQRKDFYHYPLGHGLRGDAIHAAWHQNQPDHADTICHEAKLYLYALRALLAELRRHAGDHLFAWPPKFALPAATLISDPLLSRLAFFTRYESVLGCMALRESRSEAKQVQTALGSTVELEAADAFKMRVAGPPLLEIEDPDDRPFPAWILVRDTDAGRRAQLEFRDYGYRNFPSKDNKGPAQQDDLAVVAVKNLHRDPLGFPEVLELEPSRKFKSGPPAAGQRFLLYPRFQDYNSDRIIDFLEECDLTGGGLYLQVVRSPAQAASGLPLPADAARHAGEGQAQLGFTDSQAKAYEEICGHRVVAVWGPPGTGKTHFLATAILGLAAAHAKAGKPFRVLVSAFTHAAIENLLRKIITRQQEVPGLTFDLPVVKAKDWKGESRIVLEEDLAGWLQKRQQCVVGATVYSCLKARRYGDLPGFDLVVVDEASQVRVPEASVPFYLAADEGRVVLAGDDKQLPPIVQGVYPETPPGQPLLHRSIFELIRSGVPENSPVVRQLHENRRMNDVLTRLVSELVYGPYYRCFDDKIASRRLPFTPPPGLESILDACLSPEFPLVLVVLDGVQATSENTQEANLVARLVVALREHLRVEKDGPIYADDASFFQHGVFVVSPHRAQNRAIRRALGQLRTWQSVPFVDTVDKMQGQEADAVIVSYGVADQEYALREAEFIYSLNRLNVSITRARSKSVVCLPRPLLDASPQVLDSPEAARGLAFMRGLVQRVEAQGYEQTFDLGGGVTARVLRAGK